MKRLLVLVASILLPLSATAQQFVAAQEAQKVLNGVGVETYMSAMLGTTWTGGAAASAGQQAAAMANLGIPPFLYSTGVLNQVIQYNGTNFVPSSATVTFLNASAAASPQTPSATVRTYVTGSAIHFGAGQLKVGTVLRWHINITKTAAGTAAATFDIAFGTAGTTADTAEVSLSTTAGTGAVDTAQFDIEAQVQSVNASTGVVVGGFKMVHNLAATGFSTLPANVASAASSGFNDTTPTYAGICITNGTSDAWTINSVSCEALNL